MSGDGNSRKPQPPVLNLPVIGPMDIFVLLRPNPASQQMEIRFADHLGMDLSQVALALSSTLNQILQSLYQQARDQRRIVPVGVNPFPKQN